jgi:hypothetical protein
MALVKQVANTVRARLEAKAHHELRCRDSFSVLRVLGHNVPNTSTQVPKSTHTRGSTPKLVA